MCFVASAAALSAALLSASLAACCDAFAARNCTRRPSSASFFCLSLHFRIFFCSLLTLNRSSADNPSPKSSSESLELLLSDSCLRFFLPIVIIVAQNREPGGLSTMPLYAIDEDPDRSPRKGLPSSSMSSFSRLGTQETFWLGFVCLSCRARFTGLSLAGTAFFKSAATLFILHTLAVFLPWPVVQLLA